MLHEVSLVNSIGVVVIEVLDPLLQPGVLQALVDGEREQVDVGVQRELVHGVDSPHVVHHKEEYGGPLGARSVPLDTYTSTHTCTCTE